MRQTDVRTYIVCGMIAVLTATNQCTYGSQLVVNKTLPTEFLTRNLKYKRNCAVKYQL